jgi:extracellular elastinolytic metalloproteinase
MGEGWSDAFAEWLEHKDASIPDFVLGVFVLSYQVLQRLILIPVGSTIIPLVSARSHIPLARTSLCLIPL